MAFLHKSDYLLSLENDNKDVAVRYKDKIRVIECIDPFALKNDETDASVNSFPPVTAFDIISYVMLTHSFYTSEQMKAYKSLSGYKYFEAGFVHDVKSKKIGGHIVILGKVKHSQRMNNPPLNVWIICEEEGAVQSAHCTCMAGLSEVCSHIAAVLYGLEHMHQSVTSTSCTDVKAQWIVPSTSNVPIVTLSELQLKRPTAVKSHSDSDIPALDGPELQDFLKRIEASGDDAALMQVVEPFATSISDKIRGHSFCLPSVYDVYREEYEALSYSDLCNLTSQIPEVTQEQIKNVLLATIGQNKSKEWFRQRAGRITASNFKRVCKTSLSKPSLSLVKTICYPLHVNFKTRVTDWGLQHEKVAIEKYVVDQKSLHENLRVETTGLHIDSTHTFLAASPDSIVTCDCCGKGCIEVKCPYLLRNVEIGEYIKMKNSFLLQDGSKIFLSRDHSYFYQIQVQLKAAQAKYCDFVVWSPQYFFIERIFFDEEFWILHFSKAQEFHKKVILPELLGRYFTKGKHLQQRWCMCNMTDDGRLMVKCENDTCEIQWFHLECVGLQDVPNILWMCPQCIDQ